MNQGSETYPKAPDPLSHLVSDMGGRGQSLSESTADALKEPPKQPQLISSIAGVS